MKSTVIALTVAAALGAGTLPAFAQNGGGFYPGQITHTPGAGHVQNRQQGFYPGQPQERHYGQRHDERRDRDNRWAYSGYYGQQPGYYSGYSYSQPNYYQPYYAPGYYAPGYYDDSDNSGDVLGAAILGALAGGLLANGGNY